MAQLPEERRIVIPCSEQEELRVDSYQTLFRVDNFKAHYSNRISTQQISTGEGRTGDVQIEQTIRRWDKKLKKITKLRVNEQLIVIQDVFQYPEQSAEQIGTIEHEVRVQKQAEGTVVEKSRSQRRNRDGISRKVIQHYIEWLKKNSRSALRKMFHEHRKELKRLLSKIEPNFEELSPLLQNNKFRSMLLQFLRGFNTEWRMNITATTPVHQVEEVIRELICKVTLREPDSPVPQHLSSVDNNSYT